MHKPNLKPEFKTAPVMQVGKYKGVAADKLPLSYCRWMLTQKFPEDVTRVARAKVEASPLRKKSISISIHAIDKFSLLYLDRWQKEGRPNGIGIGEYVISLGTQALLLGKRIPSDRFQNDAERYSYDGVIYVYGGQSDLPEYKELVTLFPDKPLTI
jgi:hypothetical protein